MNLLDSFFTSGTGLTLIAIIVGLSLILGLFFLSKKARKRNWIYYLLLFAVFVLAFFLVDKLVDGQSLRYSVIKSLVSGVIFTALWWLLDRGQHKGDHGNSR